MTSGYMLRSITDLRPNDHVCCLYETEKEYKASVVPYLRVGLEQREKLLYVVDAHTAETVLQYLRDDGVIVEPYLAGGQLSIVTINDAYLRDGMFDPSEIIAMLRKETERATAEGYSVLRVTVEMTWALQGLPGSERLMEYEAKLSDMVLASKCLAMCQYDRRRFRPDILLGILAVHPLVVVGTIVYDFFVDRQR